jgi:protein-tyrosine phosphatase
LIDTHCHLLPGIDDGPRTSKESVALADELVAAGVTTIVCTPHLSRRYPTSEESAQRRFREMRDRLLEAEIPVRIELAAEIAPAKLLAVGADELRRRAIGGTFVLAELQPDTPATFPEVAIDRLEAEGLVAVFAHPERCRAIQRDLAIVDTARSRGALAQTVSSSLAGAWGETIRHTAWTLLASGRVDVLASDAHGPGRAGIRLASVLEEVGDRLGDEDVHRLTVGTPERLLRGER